MINTNLPQPREGIVGTTRNDDLLSLEDDALERRRLMITMALNMWRAALSNSYSGSNVKLWQRMDNPKPGDLVVENTRINPTQGLGIFIECRKEWACTDAEWREWQAEDPDYVERPKDEVWYIQYGPQPEDICRWSNCSFIAIPTELLVP